MTITRSLLVALILVVGGQVLYHVVFRSAPKAAPALPMIIVAYVVGATGLATLALISRGPNFQWSRLTGPDVVRGVAIGVAVTLVEVGYLLAYRAGLPISYGALFVFAITTVFLAPIGIIGFGDGLSGRAIAGGVLLLAGLALLVTK